jgi:hypothetical protein
MAPSLRMEVAPVNARDTNGIERDIAAFARSANAGLIITASGVAIAYRDLIITLAALLRKFLRFERWPSLLWG